MSPDCGEVDIGGGAISASSITQHAWHSRSPRAHLADVADAHSVHAGLAGHTAVCEIMRN